MVQQAVRWGDWKAVRGRQADAWELFDLKRDERETTDVHAAHPDVMRRIREMAAAARTPERTYPLAPPESAATHVR